MGALCIGLTITIFHKKFIGEWLENLKTKKVFTKFLQRGFNLLEVSLDAFFIQLRSVKRRSVIKKVQGWIFMSSTQSRVHAQWQGSGQDEGDSVNWGISL